MLTGALAVAPGAVDALDVAVAGEEGVVFDVADGLAAAVDEADDDAVLGVAVLAVDSAVV